MSEGLTQDALLKALAGMTAEAAEEALPVTVPEAIKNEPSGNFPQGDDRETVWAAFDVLDPDCDYETWLSILMGAHSVDSSESMMAKADAWSSGGTKYQPGEVAAKWRSFEPGGGTTVATIAHLADQTGRAWRPKRQDSRQGQSRPANRPKALPESGIKLIRVSDVIEEPLKPLWVNHFYRGKLNLLCGDPGKGKSMLTADIAARFSIGACWPDGSPSEGVGSVIFFSAEDDVADTILPRLKRAGADLTKIYCLETVTEWNPKTECDERRSFALGEHVPLLEAKVKEIGDCGVIIIDPVSSYGGKVDSHKNGDVRTMLQPLTDLAAKYNIAIIAVTHLSKGSGGKAVYRATGSLAYAAAARAVWMLAEDFDDKDRRLLLPVKMNIAKSVPGLAFRIEGGMNQVPFIAWEADPVEMTADEFLRGEANRQDGRDDDHSIMQKAVEFLNDHLKNGPILSKELDDARKAHDISVAAIRRARESMATKAIKTPEGWWTLLPAHTAKDIKVRTQGAQVLCHQNLEHVAHLEHQGTNRNRSKKQNQQSQDAQGVQDFGDTGDAHLATA